MIEWRMRDVARRWGYREVCTPEFEDLELFTMRSGEGIVEEMYVFEDKGGRRLALRPEITAAVIRMYIKRGKGRAKTPALVLLCRLFPVRASPEGTIPPVLAVRCGVDRGGYRTGRCRGDRARH